VRAVADEKDASFTVAVGNGRRGVPRARIDDVHAELRPSRAAPNQVATTLGREVLLALASLFAEAWPSIQGRTAATVEEIERAGELGARLLSAIAEDAPAGSTWGDVRQRAFSLFASIYEECRRAIAYLRWHERDAEAIAPSLYRRGPRRPSPSEAPEEAAA